MSPSISDYEHLLELYPDRVQCLCTKTAIPYSEFILKFAVTSFHEACTTEVISLVLHSGKEFLDLLILSVNGDDLEQWSSAFENGFKQLCILANNTVSNTIETFLASYMLVNRIMPRTYFINEMNTTLKRIQESAPIAFGRTLNLIRMNLQSNALMSVMSSNWYIDLMKRNETTNEAFINIPITHKVSSQNRTCSCATDRTCSTVVRAFSLDSIPYVFEGLKFGCFLLETILISSLSCFYSKTCIEGYRNATDDDENLDAYGNIMENPAQLNASLTRFSINDTIETMAYDLFIESWTSNASYELFFNSCAPTHCTYTYSYRFDALGALTTVLSVFSTLSMVIRFIVPYLFQLGQQIQNRFRITPSQSP